MPALVINYFGQGALLLAQPEGGREPVLPDGAGLGAAAAGLPGDGGHGDRVAGAHHGRVLGHQAGHPARPAAAHARAAHLRARHRQIYVPFVNWGLFVFIVLAVGLFKSSSALASAYGIAVTLDMTITTVMTFFVIRYGWKYPLLAVPGGDRRASSPSTSVLRLQRAQAAGRRLVSAGHRRRHVHAHADLGEGPPPDERTAARGRDRAARVPGLRLREPAAARARHAVFLSAEEGLTPNALMHNLKHNKVLHEYNLFVSVKHHEVPWIGFDDRVRMTPLGHDCWQVTLDYGFKNDPDVPAALKQLAGRGVPLGELETSYFLSRDTVLPARGGGMALWREKLFAGMHRNAGAAADFLSLPVNRVVELGTKVRI